MYSFLTHLTQPFLLLFLAIGVALVVLWRRHHERRRRLLWAMIPWAALYLYCMPAISYLAIGSLEWGYPPQTIPREGPGAIVVLSAGIREPIEELGIQAELNHASLLRCRRAAEVARERPGLPIVLSGGKVRDDRAGPTLAAAMGDFLQQLGIPRERLVLEDQSRSTYENAVHSARWLREHNIDEVILVTDAAHLRRSKWCFLRQGIRVVPAACNYRAMKFEWSLFKFLPHPGAASGNQDALHEYLGLVWYWLHDRV